MEHLEDKAFNNTNAACVPRLFKRYVDDVFAVVETGKEELFLEYLNSLFPNCISFTIEKETRNRLPFLDALVIRSPGKLKTTVYRKPTHADRYLHFASHHPRSVMTGIIRGMVDRAVSICDAEYLEAELTHIKRALYNNGYPASLVSSVIRRRVNMPKVTRPREQGPLVVLPYYVGLGERLKRLGTTLDFRVPLDQRPGVVYKITCGCNASYIGETGNTLFHRFKQHRYGVNSYRKALKAVAGTGPTQNDQNRPPTPDGRVPEDIPQRRGRGRPRKKPAKTVTKKRDARKTMANAIKGSAVVEHSSQCSLDLRPKIICRESLFSLRKLKEAFYIRHNAPSMNRDKGVEVSEAWAGLINQTGCCALAP
ncbi:hypothetical protein M513_11296 [Trichuris suis]|uniref:Helix-turn-helix domain-containing protein n=1 Tax=Trichuris suis TaxID=68888 RepID=A0A085LS70_9BILA|nr:hypothetical protein M513_11296 [Trichuris suis]